MKKAIVTVISKKSHKPAVEKSVALMTCRPLSFMIIFCALLFFTQNNLYAFLVMPSLNTYKKSNVAYPVERVDEFYCDGVWQITANTDFTDSEHGEIFATLMGRQVTEDNPDQSTSFDKYVSVMGEVPLDSMCYNEVTYPTGTLLSDEQIDEQYATHGNKPITVMTRAYIGVWTNAVQRCLSNPKVGALCMEFNSQAMTINDSYDAGPCISYALSTGKKCYILMQSGWSDSTNSLILDNLISWAPDAMASDNVVIVYQNYAHLSTNATESWLGDTNSVKSVIKMAQAKASYTGNKVSYPFYYSFNGFTPNADIEAYSYTTTGELMLRAKASANPYIYRQVSIDSSKINRIHVRVKCEDQGDMQLFWATASSNYFDSARSKTIAYSGSSQWEELVFEMGDHAGWKDNVITQLRLDLVESASANKHTWIDYIVGSEGYSFDFNTDKQGWTTEGTAEDAINETTGCYSILVDPGNLDPAYIRQGLYFDGGVCRKVVAGYHSQVPGLAQLFWGIEGDSAFTNSRVKTVFAPANQWTNLTFDMSNDPSWVDQKIVALRFDPPGVPSTGVPSTEIVNPSAEVNAGAAPTGWTSYTDGSTPLALAMTAASRPIVADDGLNLFMLYHAGLIQTLGGTYQSGYTYTMSVDVAKRSETTGWGFGLYYDNGGTLTEVAKTVGQANWTVGTWQQKNLELTVNAGDAWIGKDIVVKLFANPNSETSDYLDNVRMGVSIPIVNPSAEANTNAAPTGWTVLAGTPTAQTAAARGIAADDGLNLFMLFNPAAIKQTLGETYQSGSTYTMSVDVAKRSDLAAGQVTGWGFGLYYDNGGTLTEIAKTQGVATWANGTWQQKDLVLTVNAGAAYIGKAIVVKLFGASTSSTTDYLDNVRVGVSVPINPPAEIVNPSAEANAGAAPTGWTVLTGTPTAQTAASRGITGDEGSNLFMLYNSAISQTLGETYQSGGTYVLSVDAYRRGSSEKTGYGFGLYYDNGGTLTEVAKTVGTADWGYNSWQQVDLVWTVNPGAACIGKDIVVKLFWAGSAYSYTSDYLDNVRMGVSVVTDLDWLETGF